MSANANPGSVDIKRLRRDLYSGRVGRIDTVEVPPMWFLQVDGRGGALLGDLIRDRGIDVVRGQIKAFASTRNVFRCA